MCQNQGSVLCCSPGGRWEGSKSQFGYCRTPRTTSPWEKIVYIRKQIEKNFLSIAYTNSVELCLWLEKLCQSWACYVHLVIPDFEFQPAPDPKHEESSAYFSAASKHKRLWAKTFHSLISLLGSLFSSTKKPETGIHRVPGDPTGKKTNIGKGITRPPKWLSTSILEGRVGGMEFLHA